jgi:hypothetical protein
MRLQLTRPIAVATQSKAARLLALWVRIPPEAWISVCCECCVLSGRGLCDGLITRPTECGASECDREASVRRAWSTMGCCGKGKK